MKRFSLKKYLLLFLALLTLLSFSSPLTEKIRGKALHASMPLLKGILGIKSLVQGKKSKVEIENAKLTSENHLLRLEIENLRTLIECKPFLEEWKGQIVPARVIYRDPTSFGSSLWVNVGEENNRRLKRKIITKNSPVLFGKSVVGVVDFVGEKESKVRLITDSSLKPSVRAWRPSTQNSLLQKGEGWYLAKGIVCGSGSALWRSGGNRLKGTGFNYDFPDEKGSKSQVPLVEAGDLLVTTGMDAVFPPNLRVGQVTKVYPLKEGAYAYELDARPAIKNMNELHTVFVISKVGNGDCDEGSKAQ